jgi:hypothetical protein
VPPYFPLQHEAEKAAFSDRAHRDTAARHGIDIADAEMVRVAFTSFRYWNRYDLADALHTFMTANGVNPPANALRAPALGTADFLRIGDRGRADWLLKEHCRKVPPNPGTGTGSLVFHRGSVVAFLRAGVGHTFTGLIKLWENIEDAPRVRPKIFLIAVQPSMKTDDDPYAVRPHVNQTRVYKTSYPAITHRGGATGQAAHSQATEMVKGTMFGGTSAAPADALLNKQRKNANFSQDAGCFVGFTVTKGDVGRGIANRYGFTSTSSNARSFSVGEDRAHPGLPTKEWGDHIRAACDQLLALETQLHTDHVTADDLEHAATGRALWLRYKDQFWPCVMPVIKTNEKLEREPDDEW